MAFDELKIYDYMQTPWIQKGIGSLYGADEISALEGMYGLGYSGKPSDARHISAMSNLSDTLAGWLSRGKPNRVGQFIGDVGSFGAGLINEIPAVGRSMIGKAPWSEIGEDVRANWKGTFGTPHGRESADIYREVYGGGPQGRTWDTSNTADRDFTRTDYGKAYQRGGSVNQF